MATTPPLPAYQEPLADGSPQYGSIVPFIAVMFVIVGLGALSCVMGRVCCAQQAEGPDMWYDCIGWARRRCWQRTSGHTVVRDSEAAVATEQDLRVQERAQTSLPLQEP